jgi:hypothetical protein
MGMLKTFIGVLAVMLAVKAAPAAAQQPVTQVHEAEEEEPARTAVRVNGIVQGFDFAGVGIEASHAYDDTFAVEASFAGVDLQRGYKGEYAQVMWRAGFTAGRHTINLGIGPGILESVDFGLVGFLVPELAYEYRLPHGLSLALGFGAAVTLNDSRDVPCQESGFLPCFLDRTQFLAGELMPRGRVALGYSF